MVFSLLKVTVFLILVDEFWTVLKYFEKRDYMSIPVDGVIARM